MPDRHADLAAFALGRLSDGERSLFEGHMHRCARCRAEVGDLLETSLLLQVTAPVAPPPELRDAVMRAVRGEDAPAPVVALPRRRALRTTALAVAACALLALAVALGAILGGSETTRMVDRQPGALERDMTLASIGGGAAKATAHITRVGAGRIVELRSSTLPKLPPSQYYELWFVGPGDGPAAPNRVSAGTFHPDSRGRVVARFFAAANPSKLPVLAVSRERRDGDPAATAPDVLRSTG